MKNDIPIRNIYYMLSYAYDVLNQGENIKLGNEEFKNIYDLCGKILFNGLKHLIKRGFSRSYVNVIDELPVVRGKISINETIKRQNLILGKVWCEYDELSNNILFNQIIKTSINTLVKYKDLDVKIKNDLIKISRYFSNIETIYIQKLHFSRIKYNRNNGFYKLIIDVCELIFDEAIVTSQTGETLFKDFMRDNRMAKLYEKFILNFYKKELHGIYVHSPIIEWQKDKTFQHIGEEYLPIMRTDIVLQNDRKQLIIDAKYYTNSLQVRNIGEVKKLISSNLYQIYSYVSNSVFEREKAGMLIYPTIDTEHDFVYSIQGKKIYVKTLNLNSEWENIYSRLMEFAQSIIM